MADYLTKFESHAEYIVVKDKLKDPNVSLCVSESEVHYKGAAWEKEYLAFLALEDGEITFNYGSDIDVSMIREMEYSFDKENWETITANPGDSITAEVSVGDIVYWRGDNASFNTSFSGDKYSYFETTCKVDVMGNVVSLFEKNPDNFSGFTTANNYDFACLFSETLIVNAKDLILPYTTLASGCYREMFMMCEHLITAPRLNATTLASTCYRQMFDGCTSLKTPPRLPATTLAGSCYREMFANCTSLIRTPKLDATTLANYAYYAMFSGCTSLNKAYALKADEIANGCYMAMFAKCTALQSPPRIHASIVGSSGCAYMFSACTSLAISGELSAETISTYAYYRMFMRCTSLVSTTQILPATTIYDYCYQGMYYNCTSLLRCPQLPATEMKLHCYRDMFALCTSLTASPVLPALTLETGCYSCMFSGCSNLNYIIAMFTSTPTTGLTTGTTHYWVHNVASTGTFVKNVDASWTNTGVSGVPTGWTIITTEDPYEYRPPSS